MSINGNRRYNLSDSFVAARVNATRVQILKSIDTENQRRFYKGSSRRAASHTPTTSFRHSSAQKAHVLVALGLSGELAQLELMHVQNPQDEMEVAQAVTAYYQLRLDSDLGLLKRDALGDQVDQLPVR